MPPAPESTERPLLSFPCRFDIKAVGRATGDFDALVLELVGRHVHGVEAGAVRTRASANGAYLSVTVSIEAQSRSQLDAVYTELSGHERVLMAL